MSDLKTCRFCGQSNYEHNHPAANSYLFRYGPRHSAHLKCALEKQGPEFFKRLPNHKLEHLPFFEIRALGFEAAFRAELESRALHFTITPVAGQVVFTTPPPWSRTTPPKPQTLRTTFTRAVPNATAGGQTVYHGIDENGIRGDFTELELIAWITHQLKAGKIRSLSATEDVRPA